MVNYCAYCLLAFFSAICTICVTFSKTTYADEAADLAFIRTVNPIIAKGTIEDDYATKTGETIRFNPQETSELKLVATGLIRLYQKFISSQDGSTCNFSPTCSRFGMACVQKYGILRGMLLTTDRLIRCNGSLSDYHHKHPLTGKYIDPISDYAN